MAPWAWASLVVWMGVAAWLYLAAPPPPEAPKTTEDEEAIRARVNAWAVRDARRWQAEKGDHSIDWRQADGHLAIVIDDVGRELVFFERLKALRWRLTFSILPGAPYAAGSQLRLAEDRRRYREVMLHLPTEPLSREAMETGAEQQEVFLTVDDPAPLLQLELIHALARVPTAVGVNNHMGSRFTADADAMAAIMPVLEARGLFWLDSRTTAETVAVAQADAAEVPVISRKVFLDHDPSPEAIRASMREAIALSKLEPVVVIAHPSAAVVEALEALLPEAHAQGVGVYPASELVARQGRSSELAVGDDCPTCGANPAL